MCQIRLPVTVPIVTQASVLSSGLTATPVIQALPELAALLQAGRFPVMSTQLLAVAVGPLVTSNTLPNQLPVITVSALPPSPIAMVLMKSAKCAPPPVPVVKSLLIADQAAPDVVPPGA